MKPLSLTPTRSPSALLLPGLHGADLDLRDKADGAVFNVNDLVENISRVTSGGSRQRGSNKLAREFAGGSEKVGLLI